jgi:hypothetical protein
MTKFDSLERVHLFRVGQRVHHLRKDDPMTEGYGHLRKVTPPNGEIEWQDSGKTGYINLKDCRPVDDSEQEAPPEIYKGSWTWNIENARFWDLNSVNDTFTYRRKDSEIRFDECRRKAKESPLYKEFADEAAAKAGLYGHLEKKIFLNLREELLKELGRLANSPLQPSSVYEVFDAERFRKYFREQVEQLIREFDPNGQN